MSTRAEASSQGSRAAHPYSMSRKNESVAWRAFVKLGGNKVVCRFCNKQMNYQSGSSTSNMVKHLQAVHKHILADVKPNSSSNNNNNSASNPPPPAAALVKGADDLSTNSLHSEPWMMLQSAPAHLRQRWQDLKLGLQKEMEHHQQAVAWSVIGAPCLGAPAGADLATDSDVSPTSYTGSTSNSSNTLQNSSSVPPGPDSAPSDSNTEWQCRESHQSLSASSFRYHVKLEPVERDEVAVQSPERPETASSPPVALSPSPPSPSASPVVIAASAPGGGNEPPPSEENDGPPPPKNKKHCASQTNLPSCPLLAESAELELRLNGLRRAQERAEELHHEHLRESRARADAALAERDHRLQLIRHAEEVHQQTLEARRQALEHSRQLHELTLHQTQINKKFCSNSLPCKTIQAPSSYKQTFLSMRLSQRGSSLLSHRYIHGTNLNFNVVPFKLSDIGEGITEVTVKEWFVNVGDTVAQFDNICEVQSDKASVTITSRYDGVITKLHYAVDDTAKVGLPLVDIKVEGESSAPDTSTSLENVTDIIDGTADAGGLQSYTGGKALATPAVRRIAGEHKIDLSLVKGSGKGGRVMKEDILAYVSGKESPKTTVIPPSSFSSTVNTLNINAVIADSDKTVPITGYTKAMVKTMTAANAIPHFVYSDEVDVGPLIEMRLRLKRAAEKRSIKLSYMPFFLKAVSLALSQFPILNASVNADCTEIIYKSRHNIGLALDSSNGLVVPNIKDVQSLQLFGVASEVQRLIEAGRTGTLGPKDITGGTFSLSNIGSIGGTYTKPVLLVPEVAIGALGRFQKLPRFGDSGAVEEANIMCVSWAADHRVIDGATVARFSNVFKELIENPVELVMQ